MHVYETKTKTKERIQNSFIEELNEKQFEQIHVADVCRRAHVSRVTFYNWYSDKFELLDDIFNELIDEIRKKMDVRQQANNPEEEPIQGYINLLDIILESTAGQYDFLKKAEENEDSWLYYYFYNSILKGIVSLMECYAGTISPRFSSEQTASFLCGGLWNFIRTCRCRQMEEDEIRHQAEELLRAILTSDAFRQ